jgi:hypothetical protein
MYGFGEMGGRVISMELFGGTGGAIGAVIKASLAFISMLGF